MMLYKTTLLLFLTAIGTSIQCKTENKPLELKEQLHQTIKEGIPEWMLNQINKDLGHIAKSSITPEMIKQTLQQDTLFLILFNIKDGKISIEFNDQMSIEAQVNTCKPIIKALHDLNSCIKLPDMQFIYSLDDAPYNFRNLEASQTPPISLARYPIPVFAPCKHVNDYNVILLPDGSSITSSCDDNALKAVNEGNAKYPWTMKQNKAIWRGSTTGGLYRLFNYYKFPRTKLVKHSIDFPEFIDAKFTNIWGIEYNTYKRLEQLHYFGSTVSIQEHMQYKYQILIDGNSSSWPRAFWQYHSNSVVFKQNSPYIVWHNELFKSWIHYIPFDYFCNDLIDKIHWAINNDSMAEKIALNANIQAQHCFQYYQLLLYFYAALTQYAKLLQNS